METAQNPESEEKVAEVHQESETPVVEEKEAAPVEFLEEETPPKYEEEKYEEDNNISYGEEHAEVEKANGHAVDLNLEEVQ